MAFVTVSIHAPAWGATWWTRLWGTAPDVSIHAPAWGATDDFFVDSPKSEVSIHAPAWGATQLTGELKLTNEWFQSTHPHGVRQSGWTRFDNFTIVSIHAPAWGATSSARAGVAILWFQSTHPHGVRLYLVKSLIFSPFKQ